MQPGTKISHFCYARGEPFWLINGSYLDYGNVADFLQRGFKFEEVILDTSPGTPPEFNMTVELPATLENNGTSLICLVVGSSGQAVESPAIVITVAGKQIIS